MLRRLGVLFLWAGMGWSQGLPLELVPLPGERVQDDRPCVQVSWPEGSLARGRCRLWFNGKEVTTECLRSQGFLSYRPYKAPPPGEIQIRFSSEDPQGAPVEKSWSFQLEPRAWIQDLQHDGQDELFEGDVLEVHFRAPPRGKASFQIDHLKTVEMLEKEPGYYVGQFKVSTSDCALAAPVLVNYTNADHREEAVAAEQVKVFGGFYRVKVLSPLDGSQVEQNFVLSGHSRPGSRVMVVPKVGFSGVRAPTTNSNSVGSTAGSIPAEVDEQGNFQLEYGLPILLPGMEVVMSIYAIDSEGNRSVPTVVRYHFK